jgi:serine/threonine-protein kinase
MAGTVDGRADQYALACTAFHLLTGVPPYGGSNLAVVIGQHVSATPPSIGAYRPELAALDPVFATAMAKDPSRRFGSCGEFVGQLRLRLSTARPYVHPALDATVAALPASKGVGRRFGLLIGALAGVLLLIAAGVFAGFKLTGHHTPAATAAAAPFTGTYRTAFGPTIGLEDVPDAGEPPALTSTYGLRSVCRSSGCVMTASRVGGADVAQPTMVFDEIGGRWLAVAAGPESCRGADSETWQVFTLQSRLDGTLAGEYTTSAANGCADKRTVTFTRTGDVGLNSLPDPSSQPPRVVSPAQALHGHYRVTRTYNAGARPAQLDTAVATYCLRTGDRCMSYFHEPLGGLPLVFGGGSWTKNLDVDVNCPESGETAHMKSSAQYPLPQPPGDPIMKLTGRGHQEQTPPCAINTDFDETFTRTSD